MALALSLAVWPLGTGDAVFTGIWAVGAISLGAAPNGYPVSAARADRRRRRALAWIVVA
jgi:hypothetical protein